MLTIAMAGVATEHHLKKLRVVFERLRSRNLKLNPEKWKFFQTEVTFLGHEVSDEGIKPDSSKFVLIQNVFSYPILRKLHNL